MKKILLFLLLVTTLKFFAQEESVFNRVNGTPIKNSIFIKWKKNQNFPEGKFWYKIDKEDEWHYIDDDVIFKIRNYHKNDFRIYYEFYNPLRFNVKMSVTDIDDPAYQVIADFISKLPATAMASQPISVTSKSFSIHGGGISSAIKQSQLLNDWIYHFVTAIDPTKISASAESSATYNTLVTKINKIGLVDEYLFKNFSIPEVDDDGVFSVKGWIKQRTEQQYNVVDYEKFIALLGNSVKIEKSLIEKKSIANIALKDVQALLSEDFDSQIGPFITAALLDNFKKYSAGQAAWLGLSYNDKFDENIEALDKFKLLLEKLNSHASAFDFEMCDQGGKNCQHYKEEHNSKLDWKSKKMKSFDYTITSLDAKGIETSGSSTKANFVVSKRLFFYPFISSGVLYTDFSYPNYTTVVDNNISRVAKTDDTKVNVRPTIFLNFLITSWDPIYPFLQLGVTTGVNDALFPVGVGLALGNSFSISGGVMLGYVKDLNALHVDDIIEDDTVLQNDLTSKGVAKFYFSVNYSLGKK